MANAKERHMWTEEEVEQLQSFINAGVKPLEISEKMNLPLGVIYKKIKYINQKAKITTPTDIQHSEDKTVEYAVRNSELREKLQLKEDEIKEHIAEKNRLRSECRQLSEDKAMLQEELKKANEEITKMKAVLQATEARYDYPSNNSSLQHEISSDKEFAIIEKIITAILNDFNEEHPISLYKRIFGSEMPAADNIVDMVTVLSAVKTIA